MQNSGIQINLTKKEFYYLSQSIRDVIEKPKIATRSIIIYDIEEKLKQIEKQYEL